MSLRVSHEAEFNRCRLPNREILRWGKRWIGIFFCLSRSQDLLCVKGGNFSQTEFARWRAAPGDSFPLTCAASGPSHPPSSFPEREVLVVSPCLSLPGLTLFLPTCGEEVTLRPTPSAHGLAALILHCPGGSVPAAPRGISAIPRPACRRLTQGTGTAGERGLPRPSGVWQKPRRPLQGKDSRRTCCRS